MVESLRGGFELIHRRRTTIAVSLIVGLTLMILGLRFIPRTYEAASQVLIVNDANGRDPTVTSLDLPAVATSTVVLSGVQDDLKIPISIAQMKDRVRTRVAAHSSIMEISYRDEVPDRAVAVSNAIADRLSRYYETISTSRADATIAKLDSSIAASRARLERINQAAAGLAAQNPLVESTKAYDTIAAFLDNLDSERQLARASLQGDVAARDAASGGPVMLALARYEKLQNDPVYGALESQIARDEAQLAPMKTTFTEAYPELQDLQTRMQAERRQRNLEAQAVLGLPQSVSPSLAASIMQVRKGDAAVVGDRAKIAALDNLTATATARLRDLPYASARWQRLNVEQDAAKADYLALMGQRTSAVAGRAEALSLGSVVVFDRAVRAEAAVVGLTGLRLAAVAFALLIAFTIGSVHFLELLDTRLLRPGQFEKLFNAPLIATLRMDR